MDVYVTLSYNVMLKPSSQHLFEDEPHLSPYIDVLLGIHEFRLLFRGRYMRYPVLVEVQDGTLESSHGRRAAK